MSASARSRPRFDITVATTPVVLPRSAAALVFQIASGYQQHRVAIDDFSGSRDKQRPIGIAVESDAHIGRFGSSTAARKTSRCSDPQFRLMLRPSGEQWIDRTLAPRRSKSSGASAEAEPLAQSHDDPQPAQPPGAAWQAR